MDQEDFRLEDILRISRTGAIEDTDISTTHLLCIFDADLTKEIFPLLTHLKSKGIALTLIAVHPEQRIFNGREYNGWAMRHLIRDNNVTHLMVWWSKYWVQVYMEWLKAMGNAYGLPVFCVVENELDLPESNEEWTVVFKKGAMLLG